MVISQMKETDQLVRYMLGRQEKKLIAKSELQQIKRNKGYEFGDTFLTIGASKPSEP